MQSVITWLKTVFMSKNNHKTTIKPPQNNHKYATEYEVDWIPEIMIPFAIQYPSKRVMTTQGRYLNNYPVGAVVHYTSGHNTKAGVSNEEMALRTIDHAIKHHHSYLVIDYAGNLYQCGPLTNWGHHAGKSNYPGLGKSVSKKLIGIEILCAGKLQKKPHAFVTWFRKTIPKEYVRSFHVQTDNIEAGHYEIFSRQQEQTLMKTLQFLHNNNPKVFKYEKVLGHDEISPGRKSDPGGSLSMTMPKLRQKLELYQQIGIDKNEGTDGN